MRKDHLTRQEVEGIVKEGDWIAQAGNRYRAYRDVRGRTVRVAFAHEGGNDITIITVFFEDQNSRQ